MVPYYGSENLFKKDNQKVRAFLYADYSRPLHGHDFYEINIVLKGKGIHQIENNRLAVKTGDVFVIPPMIAHAYSDTENLDVYHIVLHKDFIKDNKTEPMGIPGYLQFMEIEPFLRQNFSNNMFLHLSPSQLNQLQTELLFIEDNKDFDTEELLPLKHHTVWKIIYWLSIQLYRQIETAQNTGLNKYEYAVIQALEYIHQNYSEKITIELLCKKIFLSRSTFLRNFSYVCGCTPMQYLNNYRCNKCIELMGNSSLSKTEIAHACGFYDLSHMEKVLKKHTATVIY